MKSAVKKPKRRPKVEVRGSENAEANAYMYLEALLGQYPLDVDELPGTICAGCSSDNVDVSHGTWTCNDCSERGTVEIVVKRMKMVEVRKNR